MFGLNHALFPPPEDLRRKGNSSRPPSLLKDIFQCQLQNSRIIRGLDLAKCGARQSCHGIEWIHMVGQIESFRAELYRLSFMNLELSRKTHVDSDKSRATNIALAHVPVSPGGRLSESHRVEPMIDGRVSRVRAGHHLVRCLIVGPR